MAYSKTVWQDGAAPALDAAHLNNLENGVEAIDLRVTQNETDISTNATDIATANTNITTNTTNITTINNTIGSAVIIKTGTFSGSWSPTLLTTFNITDYTDYNWTVSVHQTTRVTTNGHTVLLDGYIDVDDNTVRLVSTDDGAAVAARYTLIGYRKTMSSIATLNN